MIKAKQQGNIISLKVCLNHLSNTGFRLSKGIYDKVLDMVGEK